MPYGISSWNDGREVTTSYNPINKLETTYPVTDTGGFHGGWGSLTLPALPTGHSYRFHVAPWVGGGTSDTSTEIYEAYFAGNVLHYRANIYTGALTQAYNGICHFQIYVVR